MEIKTFYFNPLRECCHLAWDDTKECVIIDPGNYGDRELQRMEDFVAEHQLKPVMILLTHGHFDHVLGLEMTAQAWKIDAWMHPDDKMILDSSIDWCAQLGLTLCRFSGTMHDLADGETLRFGHTELKVLATPGHTPGGVCFLNETDKDGISTKSKIETIFSFRIPYFVGPLNGNSDKAWFQRNDNMEKEKIYPWNFNKIVDLEASERAFIDKMRNKCTYLPWERVLPKDSLAYHRFEVLNEINNLRINGEKISVELKQEIYNEVFMKHSNVTRKKIEDFLIGKTLLERDNRSALTGIDITIKSDLMPQHAFKRLMD